MLQKQVRWFFLWILMATTGGIAESHIWVVRQDFVKFGKKDAYEAQAKEYFDSFEKKVKRHSFPCYVMQVLDFPQYLYFMPIGSYRGLDRLEHEVQTYKNTYSSTEWDLRMLVHSGTINFFFKTLQKELPDASSIPEGKESLFALSYVCLYWVEIVPGREELFEQHFQAMAEQERAQEKPLCWRVWKQTVGAALPQYLIALFADTEKEAEDRAERLELVSSPMKQIIRKQTFAKAMMRSDLGLPN